MRKVETRECGLCGGVAYRSPHPEAGTLKAEIGAGYEFECIPCLVKTRHGFASKYWAMVDEARCLRAEIERLRIAEELANLLMADEAEEIRDRWFQGNPYAAGVYSVWRDRNGARP